MAKRPKSMRTTSAGEIGQLTYNEPSTSIKVMQSGGCYDILGPLNTAARCGSWASLMVVNTDTNGHFVKFGPDNTVTAPTGLTDGVWIAPKGTLYLSSGTNVYVISDSALVGGYLAEAYVTSADDPNIPLNQN